MSPVVVPVGADRRDRPGADPDRQLLVGAGRVVHDQAEVEGSVMVVEDGGQRAFQLGLPNRGGPKDRWVDVLGQGIVDEAIESAGTCREDGDTRSGECAGDRRVAGDVDRQQAGLSDPVRFGHGFISSPRRRLGTPSRYRAA